MGRLQLILLIFIDNPSILLAIANELAQIIGVVASVEPSDTEVGLAHFVFFRVDIKSASRRLAVNWVLLGGHARLV